jgi:hypothetical protein
MIVFISIAGVVVLDVPFLAGTLRVAKLGHLLLRLDEETAVGLAELVGVVVEMRVGVGMTRLLTGQLLASDRVAQKVGQVLDLHLVHCTVETYRVSLVL